jgi:hypothetical protein
LAPSPTWALAFLRSFCQLSFSIATFLVQWSPRHLRLSDVATQLRVLSIPALCGSEDSFTSRPPHRRAKIAPRDGMDAVARSKDHTLRGSNPGCLASSPVTICPGSVLKKHSLIADKGGSPSWGWTEANNPSCGDQQSARHHTFLTHAVTAFLET